MSLWIIFEEIEETYPGQRVLGLSVGERIPLPSEKAVFPVLGALGGRTPSASGRWGPFRAKPLLGPDSLCWCLPAAERLGVGEGMFRPSGEGEGCWARHLVVAGSPSLVSLGFRVPESAWGLSG